MHGVHARSERHLPGGGEPAGEDHALPLDAQVSAPDEISEDARHHLARRADAARQLLVRQPGLYHELPVPILGQSRQQLDQAAVDIEEGQGPDLLCQPPHTTRETLDHGQRNARMVPHAAQQVLARENGQAGRGQGDHRRGTGCIVSQCHLAEILAGGTGIGYYVWNEWNNLDIAAVIFAIVMIGIVGMLLDAVLAQAGHFLRYQE
jgi:hypothetical protein